MRFWPDERVVARKEFFRDGEYAIRHERRREYINRIMDMRQEHGDREDEGERKQYGARERLAPENKSHEKRQAGVPRKEETGLEIKIYVDAVEESCAWIYGARVDAYVRQGGEEGPCRDEKRHGLEGEEDVARFREHEQRPQDDTGQGALYDDEIQIDDRKIVEQDISHVHRGGARQIGIRIHGGDVLERKRDAKHHEGGEKRVEVVFLQEIPIGERIWMRRVHNTV